MLAMLVGHVRCTGGSCEYMGALKGTRAGHRGHILEKAWDGDDALRIRICLLD